ncbi:MAG: hypothetical protein AAFQ68_13300 [Bacteroidota bacterium]
MKSYLIRVSIIFFLFQVLTDSLWGQNPIFDYDNLEQQVLAYEPSQREGVSDQKYHNGVQLLKSIKEIVESEGGQFKQGDYWNLSIAFIRLGEPNEHIGLAFQKAIDKDADKTCEIIMAFGVKKMSHFQEAIPEIFNPFVAKCESAPQKEEKLFDPSAYAEQHQLDLDLVILVNQIAESDQQYRQMEDTDWSKQTPIDQQNMRLIDSLREEYDGYVGKDLVGPELGYVMWIIVQHSTLEQMQEYLPVVHKAVQEDQLGSGPLKMLLDRIYTNTHGYQIFGSQHGVDYGPEDFCQDIKDRYDLN